MFTTPARLEQIAEQVGIHKNIGPFLQAFGQDVKKESGPELEASDLTWKEVTKAVTQRAKNYYMERVNND